MWSFPVRPSEPVRAGGGRELKAKRTVVAFVRIDAEDQQTLAGKMGPALHLVQHIAAGAHVVHDIVTQYGLVCHSCSSFPFD
jgi:hypothetical protein